jgi:hypothetical protein
MTGQPLSSTWLPDHSLFGSDFNPPLLPTEPRPDYSINKNA